MTKFSTVYDVFLSLITDDLYLELTELDTYRLLEELLTSSLVFFEFPRKNIFDYTEQYIEEDIVYCGVSSNMVPVKGIIYSGGEFKEDLDREEIQIIAIYMVVSWLGQQLASVENTRMKYSGQDFKFTSQANHMAKLTTVKKEYERLGFHTQRLYKRRKLDDKGNIVTTIPSIMGTSPQGRIYRKRSYNDYRGD